MGMLSKKRARPRIVKKRKRTDKKVKKKIAPNGMTPSAQWSGSKTAQQNYEELGIVMNSKPSMRQSSSPPPLVPFSPRPSAFLVSFKKC